MARGRHDYEKTVIAVESEGYRDMHGRILMIDDFEDTPFKWTGAGSGTHFETRQARAAYNGSYGAELDITSDAPPAARTSSITRNVPIDVTERLLMELFWKASALARLYFFTIEIQLYDGAEYHRIELRYEQTTNIWQYRDDGGARVDLPGSEQTFYDNAWNELTLRGDFTADRYISMKSNNLELNMGHIPSQHNNNLTAAHLNVAISAANITANQLIVSLDDVVLKELET